MNSKQLINFQWAKKKEHLKFVQISFLLVSYRRKKRLRRRLTFGRFQYSKLWLFHNNFYEFLIFNLIVRIVWIECEGLNIYCWYNIFYSVMYEGESWLSEKSRDLRGLAFSRWPTRETNTRRPEINRRCPLRNISSTAGYRHLSSRESGLRNREWAA